MIQACLKGHTAAFRPLVECHQQFAYQLARRFTRNNAEAEDLVQEAFVRLWKNLHRYREGHAVRSWLGKIVTNVCLDYVRSARRRLNEPMGERDVAGTDTTQRALEEKELIEVVLLLAAQLPEKQRVALVLRDVEGLEPAVVCEWLDISEDQLKSNLYHARQKIRAGLTQRYGTLWT